MEIQNCSIEDIDEIFRLYKTATDFQKTRYTVHWPVFERSMVETEIRENRQWKLLVDGEVACVWAIALDDPLIWGARNIDAAIYIHRISTNPDFRGQQLVMEIVEWAKLYAKAKNIQFIRLDTVGENQKLINHYKKCGFTFLGLSKLENTEGLPAHYENAEVSLFELEL